jgi:hypothetical protein
MIYLLGWALNYYCFAAWSLWGSRWRVLALITVVFLGGVAALRGAVGTDTVPIYEFMAAHLDTYQTEPGFRLLLYGLMQISGSPVIAVRGIAVVFTLLLLLFVLKADKDELFYLMAFFIPAFFYSHSMNGLRIGIALVVLLLALQDWRRFKPRRAWFLALFSITFHYSALVVLLYVWLVETNLKNKRNLLLAFTLMPALLALSALNYTYFLAKFELYAESGYSAPTGISGLSDVAVVMVVLLLVPFFKLPKLVRSRVVWSALLFLVIFWGVTRFSYAGLRLLELLSYALPFALMLVYAKHRTALDRRAQWALVLAGAVGMLGMYRNMLLERTLFDPVSPFLPYKTLFEE